jgi:alanyl-tRNA synthetase
MTVSMPERLYYTDSYLRDFRARITETSADGLTVYLDRTAFYPTSGGQPFDVGTIAGVAVTEVADEESGDERIAHRVASPIAADGEVDCAIDWQRRFDHMQQHTGQHLLSAVFEELFGLKTVSFHMGAESSTIDVEGRAVDARVLADTERRVNEVIYENRPVTVRFEHAAEAQGLRKPSEREGTLRVISIEGLDRSACGGTHVRSTGEIGAVQLRKVEKVRQASRVEFLCGARAVRRARADYEALSRTAQLFSAPLDEVPNFVAATQEAARTGDKSRRKLELELAAYQGKELYATTEPAADGVRRITRQAARGNLEDLRAIAQNFTALSKAIFVAALQEPPSVLLAVSEDAGIDAGKALKAALTAAGGRGGGTARMAQGSVPDPGALQGILTSLAQL